MGPKESREALKEVMRENLSVNNNQFREVLKEVLKEWLAEQLKLGEKSIIRILAIVGVAVVAYILFWPGKS